MTNNLYPYQETGVQWLSRTARGGCFDEQGLGKTAQAIVAASRLGLHRILVICPTSVTWNWKRECARWAPQWHNVQVIATGRDNVQRSAHVVIVPHGLLLVDWIREQIQRGGFQQIVLDEAHCFRKPSAKRTRLFYFNPMHMPVCRMAPRAWILTGTPMPNNPSELWAPLAGLAPERLRKEDGKLFSFGQFRDHFCVVRMTEFGPKVVGARNTEELRQRLHGFAIRRLKKDVLDLPAVRWATVPITGDADPTRSGFEIDAERMSKSLDTEALLDWVRQQEGWSAWRHACGLAKVKSTVELLTDDLESGMQKCVVFAHHLDVIDQIAEGLKDYGALKIVGEIAGSKRQLHVDMFQNDPKTRVLVCNLVAGGVGINLHAAQDAVFVEQSPVPGENAQCADRIHRIGQTKPVMIRFLALARSIDEVIVEILANKSAMIREVLR